VPPNDGSRSSLQSSNAIALHMSLQRLGFDMQKLAKLADAEGLFW
jgi:hypothetical protein